MHVQFGGKVPMCYSSWVISFTPWRRSEAVTDVRLDDICNSPIGVFVTFNVTISPLLFLFCIIIITINPLFFTITINTLLQSVTA